MIDRKIVAKEKMDRAIELLNENNIDMWVFYSRKRTDTAFELIFNTDLQDEMMFLLTGTGEKIALVNQKDYDVFLSLDLYTKVFAITEETIMNVFLLLLKENTVTSLAINDSQEDVRCDGLSLGLYKKIEFALGKNVLDSLKRSSYSMLEELRAVKTEGEISIMKECSKITTDIYESVFERIHVGLSEVDVAKIMMEECEKRNVCTAFGNPPEYPLVLNPKGGMSHRKPNELNLIMEGDVLVIDFSIRYNGYTSDIARTMYFLKENEEHAPEEIKKVADAAIRAVSACMNAIRPGIYGYEVDAVGRKIIVDAGYPDIPHAVGHQVGLEVHDGGTVLSKIERPASKRKLRKHEIYALEPTVLQDRSKASAIIEDNVLVTENGCELISKRQTELIEIPFVKQIHS